MATIKAEITACPNKRMAGKELRRLRVAADLSEQELADGYGTYRQRIVRWENRRQLKFELEPLEMQQLLKTLGASSL